MPQPPAGLAYLGYVFGALAADAVPGPCLIDLLQELGLSEPSARTMLSRQTRAGQLTSTRHGRIAVYRLAGSYRERFLRLRRGDEPPEWAGAFQMIMYDIGEAQRRDRDALRERAAAAGFGAPRSGVLIGLTDPVDWARPWLDRADLFVRSGRLECSTDTAIALTERAWPLALLAPQMRSFVARSKQIRQHDRRQRATPARAFRIFGEVMQRYAGLHAGTPDLPADITPTTWPGRAVREAVVGLSDLLGPRVSEHAHQSAAERDLSELIIPLS